MHGSEAQMKMLMLLELLLEPLELLLELMLLLLYVSIT